MIEKKRLAFYTLWDKNGNVKDYVVYYLKKLLCIADYVVVIVNGNLSGSGEQRLRELGVDFVVRENKGFDFSAWKYAIEYKGWNFVLKFDELILCNCSCYGPIFSFNDVFCIMEKRCCDFWGLYRHPKIINTFHEHLQSYFLVINNNLLHSKSFKNYWLKIYEALNWKQAVKQETEFTYYFENLGFSSSSYIDNFKYSSLLENPTVCLAHKLLEDEHFPLVKRKVFSENYRYFIDLTFVSHARDILKYLKYRTKYPIDYIYSDILDTMQGHNIRSILHDTYILDDKKTTISHVTCSKCKIALIVYSYFEDMIDDDLKYILSMPNNSYIFIVVVSEKIKYIWEKKRVFLSNYVFEVRVQKNRGRNESAYWITCRDVIKNYDLICVVHDKKTPAAYPAIKGYNFNIHCWENLLKSKYYVSEVISLFYTEPRLGLLMPPTPYFSDWRRCIVNMEWGNNLKIGKELYNRLHLHVPFDEAPDAPWGAMFWFRAKAMLPFYRYNWTVEDFPKEPVPSDGTILHALERMYPMIAQEAGFFSAWILPLSNVGIFIDNMAQCIKEREYSSILKSYTLGFKILHFFKKNIKLSIKSIINLFTCKQ